MNVGPEMLRQEVLDAKPDVVWMWCVQCGAGIDDLIVSMEPLTRYTDEVTVQCLVCNTQCRVIEGSRDDILLKDPNEYQPCVCGEFPCSCGAKQSLEWLGETIGAWLEEIPEGVDEEP